MIQYANGRFICADRISLKLPDNVFLDFNPPVIPNEGFILYSEDLKVTIDVDLVESTQEARSFLENVREDYETFRIVREPQCVSAGSMEGYGMAYALSSEICEEYVFTVPGEEPALFDVCLTQRLDELSDAEIYTKLRDELLAGIEAC